MCIQRDQSEYSVIPLSTKITLVRQYLNQSVPLFWPRLKRRKERNDNPDTVDEYSLRLFTFRYHDCVSLFLRSPSGASAVSLIMCHSAPEYVQVTLHHIRLSKDPQWQTKLMQYIFLHKYPCTQLSESMSFCAKSIFSQLDLCAI